MSAYTNPRLPQDEVNVSEKRPLPEFLAMLGGLFAVLAVIALALMLFAQTLASLLPFSAERAVAARFFPPQVSDAEPAASLQGLADQLLAPQGLPPGVTIQVHYSPLPVANASATIGGHITIYRGLLDAIDSENALALVLAHEIAHVRHRDPIASVGRGLALAVLLSTVSAGAGSQAADWLINRTGTLTVLSFSRAQEARADGDALAAVAARYGHVAGADAFFATMLARHAAKGADPGPAFLRSHPTTADRVERMRALADRRGWKADGELTPLPQALAALQSRARHPSPALLNDPVTGPVTEPVMEPLTEPGPPTGGKSATKLRRDARTDASAHEAGAAIASGR